MGFSVDNHFPVCSIGKYRLTNGLVLYPPPAKTIGSSLQVNSEGFDLEVEQFGIHIMLDGYGAAKAILEDAESLRSLLHSLPREMGMHTTCDPVVVSVGPNNHKDPGGLSGFVLIAESHLSFHTFPARGFITIDIYTCRNDLNVDSVVARLVKAFQIADFETFVQPRGQRYPARNLEDSSVVALP